MPALGSMRILDMTQYEAGTSCTQALAWLGADVVKIEPPGTGDPGRGLWEDSEYFVNWNSNKRSVVIDLRQPQGRELLLKMVPRYDVFVENYGPGVVEHETLGPIPLLGWPARLSASDVPIQAAPLLGRHTSEVLTEDLDLSPGDIERMEAEGIIEIHHRDETA